MKANLYSIFPFTAALSIKLPTLQRIYCKNPACIACGNPAYPMCMDSCKLFDD